MSPSRLGEPPSGVEHVDPRIARTRHDVLAAAIHVLTTDGWDAVTHARVAAEAGYAKATLYTHWPERIDLLRAALTRYGEMPHHEPTGDLRADLLGELASFRRALTERGLDRVLVALAEHAADEPELAAVRDGFVAQGERVIRELLATVTSGAELEAATLMLCGAVVHGVLMHGAPPADEVVERAVEATLARLRPTRTRRR